MGWVSELHLKIVSLIESNKTDRLLESSAERRIATKLMVIRILHPGAVANPWMHIDSWE